MRKATPGSGLANCAARRPGPRTEARGPSRPGSRAPVDHPNAEENGRRSHDEPRDVGKEEALIGQGKRLDDADACREEGDDVGIALVWTRHQPETKPCWYDAKRALDVHNQIQRMQEQKRAQDPRRISPRSTDGSAVKYGPEIGPRVPEERAWRGVQERQPRLKQEDRAEKKPSPRVLPRYRGPGDAGACCQYLVLAVNIMRRSPKSS